MTIMTTKELKNLLERAETWPEQAQDELVQMGREIEAEIGQGLYRLNDAEREGIDRGLAAMRERRFASDERIAAIFGKARSTRA
jgi:hypothetical protein